MKVAIVGAGFGGLTLAYRLAQKGVDVTVFESETKPGGLAIGFKKPQWEWTIEHHYHHWFTNDYAVLNLAKEINHQVVVVRPKTSTFVGETVSQLDSPLSLLMFNQLSFIDRLRTGAVLAYLKTTSNWKNLEKQTAKKFITRYMGKASWNVLWGPLFDGKFHKYASKIPASWFWARIKKRTASLAYPVGGFSAFADHLASKCADMGVKIEYKSVVKSIKYKNNEIVVNNVKNDIKYDKVVVTLPFGVFASLAQDLPSDYVADNLKVRGLGAANLLLSLKQPFLKDGTYWLNINEKRYPFLAVVEHTNFMDKKHYNNEHLVYIGNYLPVEHPYFTKDAQTLLSEFLPYLQSINSSFRKSHVNDAFLFKARFAQPIIPLNYSEIMPDFKTPIPNLYLCNMSQVYPWDRGTNYAVENGGKVANLMLNEK